MSAHTPGPWVALPEEVDKDYLRIRGTKLGGRYKIANVHTPIHDNVILVSSKESFANARLIAAAPELLSWLVWSLNNLSSDAKQSGQYDMARAALAKATGEQA